MNLVGKERVKLNWRYKPVPTISCKPTNKRPLTQPIVTEWRKPPKIRNIEPDQYPDFQRDDLIHNIGDLKEQNCPHGFQININEDSVCFYKINFDNKNYPIMSQTIHVNKELKVKLACNGIPAPLPRWFTQGHNAKLTKFSMLENFPVLL